MNPFALGWHTKNDAAVGGANANPGETSDGGVSDGDSAIDVDRNSTRNMARTSEVNTTTEGMESEQAGDLEIIGRDDDIATANDTHLAKKAAPADDDIQLIELDMEPKRRDVTRDVEYFFRAIEARQVKNNSGKISTKKTRTCKLCK